MKRLLSLGLGLVLMTEASAQAPLKHDSYLELNGKMQYMSIPSHSDFDIKLGKSYTITYWMYGYSTFMNAETPHLVSRRDDGKNAPDSLNRSGYALLGLRSTQQYFFGASLPNAAGKFSQSYEGWAPLKGGTMFRSWHHCALVVNRENGTIKLYIDGEEVHTADKEVRAWVAENKLPVTIGAGQRDGKPYGSFFGRIDNVRFYQKALSPEALREDIATESVRPDTEGLVAAFDFDKMLPGDTQVVDATGRHTATLHNFPTTTGHSVVRTFTAQRTNGHLIGRGKNQALSTFSLGLEKPVRLEGLTISTPTASHTKNVDRYRIVLTDNGDRYDHRKSYITVAEGKPSLGTTTLKATSKAPLVDKHSRLWLVADVSSKAVEGDTLTTQIETIKVAGAEAFRPKSEAYKHEFVLFRSLVWNIGENGSNHYRIPALIRLSNGNLVAGVDKRKTSDYDLPSDIDVEVKISRDNGRTWSKPITIAKGTPEHGFGDAAFATDGKNIYAVMVAGSGLWFYPSHAKKPLEMFFSMSSDGGLTWTPVREITNQVYTDRYPNGGFFGSGNGIITSRGRIAFVAAMRTEAKWGGNMDNVMVYSDDQGKTWHSSPVARTNGDEAKIIELSNGDLLLSSRNRAWRPTPRTYVISRDHGHSWSEPAVWNDLVGNACNTALTRYSLESEGKGAKNILLHTLIESTRRDHLRIYMSEDEGKTWHVGNTLCDGEAAYSEVTRLKNGNVGIISEEDDRPAYDIYFTEVSLDWIRKGKPLKK